ncbi:MAG: phosphate ABC transporter substrate-binding protein [Leptolyngbya sp. SIO4C1]|nr:phosphate ABC transporter substrate-binding protein [Leptolyngbya sp. SIO4C1]
MRHCTWGILLSGLALLPIGCGSAPTAAQGGDTSEAASVPQTQQTIAIIGASTPYPALKLLASTYEAEAPETQITFLESSQSGGGIAGVKAGLVEIGTVTRAPKPEEADDSLVYRQIAKDALLVATHPSVEGIDNLTTEELQAVYSGEVTNWQALGGPDAEIVVLDRAEDTSAKRLLRKHYLGPDLKNAANSIMLRRESDVIEAIQNTPYSIGTLSLAKTKASNLSVNWLSLDGVTPTPDNLDSDSYVMQRALGIVWYGTPSEATQDFIDFIFSSVGADILSQAGFTPTVAE